MKVLDYRSRPDASGAARPRLAERIGYAAFVAAIASAFATAFGIGSDVCAFFGRRAFLDPWGLAAGLLLTACWVSGGVGIVAGLCGLVADDGRHRRHAIRVTILCMVVVAVTSGVSCSLYYMKRPMGGAPGGF